MISLKSLVKYVREAKITAPRKGKKEFEKKFKVKNIVVPGLEWMADIDESVNEAPEHDLARELNKASDVILKLIKIYGKKADVDGMTRSWMMGLHAKLKKAGIKI